MNKLNKLITFALVATGIAAFAAQAQAEYTDDCITFSSAASFSLNTGNTSKNWDGTLWTSTDKVNWTEWKGALVTAAQAGGAYNLYVRGNTDNTKLAGGLFVNWVLIGSDIACTGNIETLRGATGDQPSPTQMAEYCYANMFEYCGSLTAAPALPATELAKSCYESMFSECTSLTAAPVLPATELKENCYGYMFFGCTSLTSAPVLPATELKEDCYRGMFSGCTALTSAPALNAMTLADKCYYEMFEGCTSLLDIPVLPATELKESCYESMFYGCTSLEVNKAPPGKEWKIPAENVSDPGGFMWCMLDETAGDLSDETPEPNTTYYIASAPVPVVPVTYLDAKGNEQTTNAIVVAASDSRVTWKAGWYVVTNEVTVKGGADCSGAVHLILADTGALTISGVVNNKAGIGVSGDNDSLAIYGQKEGTGELEVTGGYWGAGIGGGYEVTGKNITINGGTVTATGGSGGAGIGGGYCGEGKNITINAGTVTATGRDYGAGIGGGGSDGGDANGLYITINGGEVTANGSEGAAGIGGGFGYSGSNITINGGEVKATSSGYGAGIGGGKYGTGSDITINGGTVTATGGEYDGDYGAGIGSGYGGSAASKIYAAEDVIVKAGASKNPTAVIAHLSTQDIASDLADKRYATAEFSPTEPIASFVTAPEHATVAVYSNKVVDAQYKSDGTVWSNRAAKVVYTVDSDKDRYFKGATWVKAITNELDTTVNPAVDTNDLPAIVEVTCSREEVKGETTLEADATYTATPTTGNGGVFNVKNGATLTGTNVTFAANEAKIGGAIYNNGSTVALKGKVFEGNEAAECGGAICNATGTLSLDGVTFDGNKAQTDGGAILISGGTAALKDVAFTGNEANFGGAIHNDKGTLSLDDVTFEGNEAKGGGAFANSFGTVHFDGPVTLVTTNDTIYNGMGTLNWNLAGGKQGVLNGYDKLINAGDEAKLQLTVGDYAASTNFTIATGNFSDVKKADTDTFSISPLGKEVKINGDLVTSDDGKTGYKLVTEEDLSVPTTNLVLKITKYTCVHTELESGDSTNLVAGVYTAAPTGNAGGVFNVKNGATLTGTDVVFADNEAYAGGAIYNDGGTVALKNADFKRNKAQTLCGAICNTGTLSLDGVTFEGNEAMDGGGAIGSMGTAHFDGAVTLRTASDTINNTGTLNWNLAGGKQGVLNGYQNITNDYSYAEYGLIPTLQLTVEDYVTAVTNFVIATGDFSDVKGKDTFLMTNVTGGVTATIKIGGITQLNGTWWSLKVERPLKLKKALKAAAAETSRLVLATVPADELAQLKDVEIVDKKGVTNATAVVKVGDTVVKQNPNGSYTVPKGCAVTLEYQATDDYMFGPGWTTKTVVLEPLTDDYAMTDDDKPSTQEKWVDVREVAIDTRERIVVGSPDEVLPIAYSTNNWGEVTADQTSVYYLRDSEYVQVVENTNENGYVEWQPTYGEYGKYTFWQSWYSSGAYLAKTNATIYYSTRYPLTLVKPKNGTYEAKVAGVAITNGTPVLGYEYVNLKATPTYDNANRYELAGWAATTGGVVFAEGFTNTATAVTRFEMPNCAAAIAAGFQWKSNYNEQVAVKQGESWQVFEGETYSNTYGPAMHNMGHAYGSGATFSDSKTPLAGSAVYTEGTFAFTNVTFKGNETTLESGGALRVTGGSTGILVRCKFESNKAAMGGGGAICNDGRLTLEDCYFAGNNATVGGALCNYAGAEVVLRGTNTFETNFDTVFNGGKLVWDFTDGSFPCFKGYLFFTNAVEGTLWIRTVDDIETNVYKIASGVVGSTTGKDTFTVTNDYGSAACTVYTGTDPDEGWAYLGSKRYRLTVSKDLELLLAVEWGAFDVVLHYDLDTVVTTNFRVNTGMVLPKTNWDETLPPVPLGDAWFGEARKKFAGWMATNEYYDAAGDLVAWTNDAGKIDYYQPLVTAIPPMTLGDQEFWARWSYVDMWYAGTTNATGEITDMVMAELVEWTGEMTLSGTYKGRPKMQDCVEPKWEDPLTAPWYWGFRPYINLLTVDKNVVHIGAYAFYDCYALREVFFGTSEFPGTPPGVGTNVFEGCDQAVGYYWRAVEDAWTNRLENGKWEGLTMYCREDVPTFAEAGTYVMMNVEGRAVLTVADGITEVTCTSNPKGYEILAPVGVTVKFEAGTEAEVVPMGRTEVVVTDFTVSGTAVELKLKGIAEDQAVTFYGKKELTDPEWTAIPAKNVGEPIRNDGESAYTIANAGDYHYFTYLVK